MNRLIASGLALALLAGGALAQSAAPAGTPPTPAGMKAPPPPGGPDAMSPPGAGAPPPPTPGGMRAGVRPPPPGGPGAMDNDGPGGPPDGPRGHRPPPPKAAHFRIERGDMALDVKCADDEPMKACGDLALEMLDKLQAVPGQPMPGGALSPPGAPKP